MQGQVQQIDGAVQHDAYHLDSDFLAAADGRASLCVADCMLWHVVHSPCLPAKGMTHDPDHDV